MRKDGQCPTFCVGQGYIKGKIREGMRDDAITKSRGTATKSNHHFRHVYVPAENTENQVHHKEGSNDDHRDEVDPLPGITHSIFYLYIFKKKESKKKNMVKD